MPKLPKFLIAENPMTSEKYGHQEFIVHTQHPVIVAQIIDCSDLPEAEIVALKRQMTFGSTLDLGAEYYLIAGSYIDPTYGRDMDAQKSADNIAGIMRRMADWYQAYIEWEDKQQH